LTPGRKPVVSRTMHPPQLLRTNRFIAPMRMTDQPIILTGEKNYQFSAAECVRTDKEEQ
jgi:hypothetical protein